ncbi:hypothetical protein [Okeania sp. SIO1I7]|uniref:hypothetical protein n=1 Tax=Okeania sp. SIO1I7 TaxID=2607772 RepID=UPI0013F956D1|nr:hypothetical protein [Okeania sp. SIO1I7]NET27116.1 hypothetical protein [Okeania sp. SIO1I7]
MFKPENNLSRFKRVLLSYTFLVSLIVSIPITVGLGYLVKSNKEYKQSILWYEILNEDTKYTKVFSDFVKEVQKQLTENYDSNFNNAINNNYDQYKSAIVDNTAALQNDSVPWEIEKTRESINVYYSHTRLIDFNNLQDSSSNYTDRNQKKQQSRNDKVVQAFTKLMVEKFSNPLIQNNNGNGIDNLRNFSKVIIDYFTNNQGYSSLIPDMKINNIYILKVNTGFLISYPASNQDYKRVDFQTRPWYRATQENYHVKFFERDRYDNTSGITGIYIDVNDENNKPNVIRTLWYKFTPLNSNEEYILCFDLFLDKSGQISSENNLTYLQQMLLSEGAWKSLLPLSLLLASCLSLVYEWVTKDKSTGDGFSIIKIEREKKHYAGKDENEISFTIVVETKDINESKQLREAGWNFNIQNSIQAGISSNQSHARQQEATSKYEFTDSYDLNMSQKKPEYKCIETWKVVSKSRYGKTQNIGFFVVKWNTNNGADIEDGLEIQSIYWEKGYEEYLESFKEQLFNHLLISDAEGLVAILDRDYIENKQQKENIPDVISEINSLKKIIENSNDLKQGKIAFSDFETLTDLYNKGTVNAICTLHFLKKLSDQNKLKDFFQTSVSHRYLIENEQDEFKNFYDSLDDETQTELRNNNPFQIMVYQDDNIVGAQDDFCIISINNVPKLVAYIFTNNQFSSTGEIGWISWRQVDTTFYDRLYKCQLNKSNRIGQIENLETYLN